MAIKRVEKEEVVVEAGNEISVKLKAPIEAFGEPVAVLTMRVPKYKDIIHMMKASDNEAEQFLHLVSKLSELPASAIGDLSLGDVKEIQKALAPFLA